MGDGIASYFDDLPWAAVALRLWRWGTTFMRPAIIFGCPIQQSKDYSVSWWHVPVSVKRRPLSRSQIESVRAYARIYADPYKDRAIEMMWRETNRDEPHLRVTLRVGEVMMIPVVWRKEGDGRNAFISGKGFFEGAKDIPIAPKDGQTKLVLRVKYGNVLEMSNFYIIRNRDMDSNGHFVLEAQYEGLGTGAFVHER